MTKSILISIQPQHLKNILNGDKTYEVRKVVPKWVIEKLDRGETVEAYLYCTKGKPYLGDSFRVPYGKDDELIVYGLFDKTYTKNEIKKTTLNILNGTIPVKVVIDGCEEILDYHITDNDISVSDLYETSKMSEEELLKKSCLTKQQLTSYLGTKGGYALHISKVEILDEVMKLDDFVSDKLIVTVCGDEPKCYSDTAQYYARKNQTLQHPPMNMMSVWVK
jgi:predicted transcriptional regulator